jgi:hypothetical protein
MARTCRGQGQRCAPWFACDPCHRRTNARSNHIGRRTDPRHRCCSTGACSPGSTLHCSSQCRGRSTSGHNSRPRSSRHRSRARPPHNRRQSTRRILCHRDSTGAYHRIDRRSDSQGRTPNIRSRRCGRIAMCLRARRGHSHSSPGRVPSRRGIDRSGNCGLSWRGSSARYTRTALAGCTRFLPGRLRNSFRPHRSCWC